MIQLVKANLIREMTNFQYNLDLKQNNKVMMKLEFIIGLCLLTIISSCTSSDQNNVIAEDLIEEYSVINFSEFRDWDIKLRDSSIAIFDYKVNSRYFGFLVKYDSEGFNIRNKGTSTDNEFVLLNRYPSEELLKHGLSKEKVQKIVTDFRRSKAENILYIKSFESVLVQNKDMKLMLLLSDKRENLLDSYVLVRKNCYLSKDNK